MINNPDGSKRLPTKEEILDGIRRQAVSRNGNISTNPVGTNSNAYSQDRYIDSKRPGAPLEFERGNRSIQGDAGSGGSTNGRERAEAGSTRGIDSSTNEYSGGTTTSYTGTTSTPDAIEYTQPLKRSKFAPYRKAVQEAFSGRKKDGTGKTKIGADNKLFSESEVKNKRNDLIETILWQSEHMDQFIIATTKGHDKSIVIWGDIDRSDAGVIADYLLTRAKTDRRVAHAVRAMLDIKNRIQLGLILVPRAYRSITIYLERGLSIR